MTLRKSITVKIGCRVIGVAIVATLAAILFSSHYSSSTQEVAAQARRQQAKTRPKRKSQLRTPLVASSFTHESHSLAKRKLDCSHCHAIPSSAAWDETAAATKLSIKGYPYHDSCLPCHEGTSPQFFRGAAPPVCKICHTRSSPHLVRRELRTFAKQTRRMFVSELPGFLSHGKHEGLKLPNGDTIKCEYCHSPMQMKDKRMAGVLAAGGSEVPIADGAFKASPSGHASCFECHWDKHKPMKDDCGGCHLAPDAFGQRTRIVLSTDVVLAFFKDSNRLAIRFNHDSKYHRPAENPKLVCTACHRNINQSEMLDIPNVKIQSCDGSECHFKNTGTSIISEMYAEETEVAEGTENICTGCHTKPIGRVAPPCSHLVLFADKPDDYPNAAKQISAKKCQK